MRVYVQQLSPLDKLLMKSVVGKDGGVVDRSPDTSVTATCRECSPPARFIGIGDRSAKDNLARHVEDRHAPKMPNPRTDPVMLQRVVDTITERIADGSLAPGKVVNQGELAAELGVTRHYTQLAVEQLIVAGTLRWTDANSTYARRAVVCSPG